MSDLHQVGLLLFLGVDFQVLKKILSEFFFEMRIQRLFSGLVHRFPRFPQFFYRQRKYKYRVHGIFH